jgi:hypothetical protein
MGGRASHGEMRVAAMGWHDGHGELQAAAMARRPWGAGAAAMGGHPPWGDGGGGHGRVCRPWGEGRCDAPGF